MFGAAWRIFRFVVVEFPGGYDFDPPECLVAHHRAGDFLAGNIRLNQHPLAECPVRASQFLRWMLVILAHEKNTDAGTLGYRLHDVPRLKEMALRRLLAGRGHASRHRDLRRLEHSLGDVLLHRQSGSENAGMTIRNAENLEHALQGAILARPAMQHIERNLRLERAQLRSNLAVDVHAADTVTDPLKRVRARLARTQGHVALGRPSTHENRDVFHGFSVPARPV